MLLQGDYSSADACPALTQKTINETIEAIGNLRMQVLCDRCEFIPDGPYNDNERLGFAICSLRKVGRFTPSFLAMQLCSGVPSPVPDTYRELARDMEIYLPDVYRSIVSYYRPFKYIPDFYKASDMFIAICALAEMHDRMGSRWPGPEPHAVAAYVPQYIR